MYDNIIKLYWIHNNEKYNGLQKYWRTERLRKDIITIITDISANNCTLIDTMNQPLNLGRQFMNHPV